MYIIYIVFILNLIEMIVYTFRKTRIISLSYKEVIIFIKYFNFIDIFFTT